MGNSPSGRSRPGRGEEPQTHKHEEDEVFYVLSGSITFNCGSESFEVSDHGFAFVPSGTLHGYTINSAEVRLLSFSTPSAFGDNIERTGSRIR